MALQWGKLWVVRAQLGRHTPSCRGVAHRRYPSRGRTSHHHTARKHGGATGLFDRNRFAR